MTTSINKNRQLWLLALMVTVASLAMTLTACGSDEPDSNNIDYYIRVDNPFMVNNSEELAARYTSPAEELKAAIRKVYPTPDSEGADEVVMAACSQAQQDYIAMYAGYTGHFTCTLSLLRVRLQNGIIKQNEVLATYEFNINNTATDDEDDEE